MTRSPAHLIVVCRISSLAERVRVRKLTDIASRMGWRPEVWALPRASSEAATSDVGWVGLPGGGRKAGPLRWLGPLGWAARVFARAVSFRRGEPTIVVAVGLDAALPVFCARALRPGLVMIFDNADNAPLSVPLPRPARRALTLLEAKVAKGAERHWVPAASRWPDGGENLRIVPNRPTRAAVARAAELAEGGDGPPTDRIRLYVNGWLTRTRGLPVLLDVVRLADERGVPLEVFCAGRLACDEAEQLVAMPRTTYLGLLPNEEALALYRRCHWAFTYYDPALPINRLAEPNKWGDCLAMETPFIANREIAGVHAWEARRLCVTFPYGDVEALVDFLEREARARWAVCREALRREPKEFWDDRVTDLLDELRHPRLEPGARGG